MSRPDPRTVLEALTRPRLAAVGRELGAAVPAGGVKEAQVEALGRIRRPPVQQSELHAPWSSWGLKGGFLVNAFDSWEAEKIICLFDRA